MGLLFIAKGLYKNLKEEILFNQDNEVNIKKWNKNVVLKAQQYIDAGQVKSITIQIIFIWNL